MSRGNAKQPIFVETEDYEQFLEIVSATTERFQVLCRAYCLMPNHFHLLLQPAELPLSRMMQQLNSTYSQWFNRRYLRVGHLLQGRFKALLVDRDQYLLRVIRYIVLNPVKAGLVTQPEEWVWSSYHATVGRRTPPPFLALDDVWSALGAGRDQAGQQFAEYVAANSSLDEPYGPVVFGSQELIDQVGVALEQHRETRDISRAERFAVRPSLDELLSKARDGSNATLWRDAFRLHGYTLREIGDFAGYHYSTVWRRIRHVEAEHQSAGIQQEEPENLIRRLHSGVVQKSRSDP
jgi:REP element-mobilizing transposase RayT